MEVNKSYIEFLLQLLNNDENIDIENHQEELIVNLYLTLLSLSNLEYSEKLDQVEKETIRDFLTRLNNLKLKIQLKRKTEEINKFAEELITQYYENINILSIYIKDGIELENVINTMDAKSLTKLVDTATKDKMNKEYSKEERNLRRAEIIKLLPTSEYYIENNTIFIKNGETYEELSLEDFLSMFSYLLNPDNYNKTYADKQIKKTHQLIIANIIKLIIVNDMKKEELDKVLIPMLLTYILSFNINSFIDMDTSKFNIDNIKISELYALASNNQEQTVTNNTPKWRNISIPNEYLLEKIKEMISTGMYYFKENSFVLERIENNTSDFKVSITMEEIKEFIKNILESKLNNNYSKKK